MKRIYAVMWLLVLTSISSQAQAGFWWHYGWDTAGPYASGDRGYWWEYGWDKVTEALATNDWLTLLNLFLEAF